MTKAKKDKITAKMLEIKKLLFKWRNIFGLKKYILKVSFQDSTMKRLEKDDIADVNLISNKRIIDVVFNIDNMKNWNEHTVIHELAHVLIWKLWKVVKKCPGTIKESEKLKKKYERAEEVIADNLADIFLKLDKKNG